MMYWVGLAVVILVVYGLIVLEERVNDKADKY